MLRYLLLVLSFVVALPGCATHIDHLAKVRAHYFSGDLAAASKLLDERIPKNDHDVDVLKLERAMVLLSDGPPREAEVALREVRDRFDHLEQGSLAESALAMLSDDNRRAYAGEDYEKVLIRAMLAMSNLMHDGGDAGAYALQVTQKQQEIVTKGADDDGKNLKEHYKQVAFGHYLYGVLREETHANYDDACRAYQQVSFVEPEFSASKYDLQRIQHGGHSSRGNGVVYVFTMIGHGPYKTEMVETPSTAALMIADFLMKSRNKYSLPISQAPVKVPRVVVPPNSIDNVLIAVNGRPAGRTETVTDIGKLAVQQYDAIYDQVVARAIIRRLVKRGVVEGGKMLVGVDSNSPVNLAFDAAELAWGAAEAADTRCWGLLPEKIQVCRLELPVGEHQLLLTPARGNATMSNGTSTVVRVEDGRNTYILANFPTEKPIGKISARTP